MFKKFLLLIILSACFTAAQAYDPAKLKFHNEDEDKTRLNEMLIRLSERRDLRTPGQYMVACGKEFLDKPYVAGTLEGQPEMLNVNIDEFDCVTFVETSLALALTLNERRNSWRDFVHNLQRIRYRSGEIDGYPSRLHYVCDWAVDNMYRGIIKDVTPTFSRFSSVSRTIDFMSNNADKYPALADSLNLVRIKDIEIGFRQYKFPYIKTIDVSRKEVKKEFLNGDILGFVSNLKDLDVAHMGMVIKQDGEPYVMHASSSAGKVVISAVPLDEFLKKNRQFIGVRVFRIDNH